jgi:hypothetical protein
VTLEAVVAALKAHPASAAVQQYGCWALLNICWTDAALRRRAREAGAVAVLEAAVGQLIAQVTQVAQAHLEFLGKVMLVALVFLPIPPLFMVLRAVAAVQGRLELLVFKLDQEMVVLV